MRDHLTAAGVVAVSLIAGATAIAMRWPGPIVALVVVAYVVGYAAAIPTASGRRVSLAPAVAAGVALISGGSLVLVVASAAVALPLGLLVVHVAHGSRVTQYVFPAEPVGVAVFAAVMSVGGLVLDDPAPTDPAMLSVFAIAVVAGFTVTILVRSITAEERRVLSRRLIALRAIGDWPAHAALYASGALFAVTHHPMGLWAVPLAGLPYLFSHVSLQRLQHTRRTYEQTIRALGAIPEAGGHVDPGHSSRTAELAVAIGAEVGLGASTLRQLEYSALLHDIGRVVLANPSVASTEYSFTDVSKWSAAIIGEVRYLERVAGIVALQHAPYRREGQVRDATVPRASQVVRIAARYDSALGSGVTSAEAVETLHQGAAYDYDPEIVMALRRVLERRGALAA